MKPHMFREYDIRGIFNTDFDLTDAMNVGRGYGTYLKSKGGKTMALGRDCRLSSNDIREALVEGLVKSGLEVTDVGICPSPVLYFAQRHLNTDGAVMITASHNPPEYNGFKICLGTDTIFGDEIQLLRKYIENADHTEEKGEFREYDIITPYSDWVVDNITLKRPVKVGVDAGNATGGVVAGPILERLGCTVEPLYFEMDGNFPNHTPDPTVAENLVDLSKMVVDKGLDLGVGFDGDSDRIGVVDEKGELILGDMLLLIFARDILADNPGGKIVAEVKSSQLLFDDVEARGGKAIMWKAGHSLIRSKLKSENALLGGEVSGHVFFNHRFMGHDDGVYAACRMLEIVSRRDEPVSQYLSDLPKVYNTPELRIDCPEEHKFRLVELVRDELKEKYKVVDVDGARVIFDDGWGLIRASNTGPILVLRYEAQSKARLEEIRTIIEDALDRAKAKL